MDVEVTINGKKILLDCEIVTVQGAEPDVGIMGPYVEDWKAYHWEESRELEEDEYDLISEEDKERIEEALNQVAYEQQFEDPGIDY